MVSEGRRKINCRESSTSHGFGQWNL
uniref:Uncharacterized protein n=1 Tax=Rhizophora mucronata TaxID=61149 RepID=A0A2P2QTE2_RHIMU